MVLNTYPTKGKRKRKWISTGLPVKGNKRKAEAMLRETLRAYTERESVEAQKAAFDAEMPFIELVRLWLDEASQRVDEVTMQGYEAMARTHVIPYFDERQLRVCDITLDVLQTYIDEKYTNGRLNGKGGLSAKSMRQHKNVLEQSLNIAVREGMLPRNPCEFLRLPPIKKNGIEKDVVFYTESQLEALFAAAADEPLLPVIKFTALYGLRRSEVCGLRWSAINFDQDTFTINHTVVKVAKRVEKDKTKNESSHRTFPLSPEMRAMLLDMKAAEEENRILFGSEYVESDYVFKWPNGTPFSPDYITQGFSRILRQNNLPHIRFHDLRHSCASNLLAMGYTLKDVQEWLGHSDIKTTANIYGHLDIERKKALAVGYSERIFHQNEDAPQ